MGLWSRRVMATLLCAGVGVLFVYAGWTKLEPPHPLASRLPQLRTLVDDYAPHGSARRAALVAFELTLGAWLICGIARRRAIAVASVTLLLFTAVLGVELTRPDPRACGCLPIDPSTGQTLNPQATLWASLGRNLVSMLSLGLAWGVLRCTAPAKTRPESPRHPIEPLRQPEESRR